MDIALAIEKILFAAEYYGSVTDNTQEAWQSVVWQDKRREKPTWSEIQAAWNKISVPTMDEARAAKLAEIVAGANAIKAALQSKFSDLESNTWPEQEAGARAILGSESHVKNEVALLVLQNLPAKAKAKDLVEQLAHADGTDAQSFAARIVVNADTAYHLGTMSLLEQRAMEAAVRALAEQEGATAEEMQALPVRYTVLEQSGK